VRDASLEVDAERNARSLRLSRAPNDRLPWQARHPSITIHALFYWINHGQGDCPPTWTAPWYGHSPYSSGITFDLPSTMRSFMTNVASIHSMQKIDHVPHAEGRHTASQASAQPKPAHIEHPVPFSSHRIVINPWLGWRPSNNPLHGFFSS
jgi:hypothetical protein